MQLLRSTAKVGAATITSRILGFVRDMVFARYFGASAATDAFFLAFKIPNFMRRLFAEGSFSLAFVPVLSEVRASGDRHALRDLIDHVSGTLMAILLVITAIGVLAAPAVLAIFAPGWLIEVTQLVVGTSLGARFAGRSPRLLLTGTRLALVNVGAMLALSALFAYLRNPTPVASGLPVGLGRLVATAEASAKLRSSRTLPG